MSRCIKKTIKTLPLECVTRVAQKGKNLGVEAAVRLKQQADYQILCIQSFDFVGDGEYRLT